MPAEALGPLADFLAAHRLVEHPGAIGFEHPEVEAEVAIAHEMARRGAHQSASDAAPLLGLEDIERVDLAFETLDWRARRAAAGEADEALAGALREPRLVDAARRREATAPGNLGLASRIARDHVERKDAGVRGAPALAVHVGK